MTFGLMLRKYLFVHVRDKYNLKSYIDSIFLLTAGIFNPSISPLCLKCKTEVGTLTHCLWSCDRLQRYWFLVLGEMEKILMQFDSDPVSLLLGIPNNCIVSSANKKLFNILSFAVRKNILLNWISDKSPSLKGWHKIFFELIPLEHLTYVLHQKTVISGLNGTSSSPYYYKEYCVVLFSGHLTFLLYFSFFFPLIC